MEENEKNKQTIIIQTKYHALVRVERDNIIRHRIYNRITKKVVKLNSIPIIFKSYDYEKAISVSKNKIFKLDNSFEINTKSYVDYDSSMYNKKLISIFKNIFTKNGFAVRENQVLISLLMLNSSLQGHISICEAEVGTGKTHAYLIASLLYRKYNTIENAFRYNYDDFYSSILSSKKSIVISTSNITLQKAIIEDYLPNISEMLKRENVIKSDLTAVVRKGKGHYICDKRLGIKIAKERNKHIKNKLNELLNIDFHNIDMDELYDLHAGIKKQICVTRSCNKRCELSSRCRFKKLMSYLKESHNYQICNHNYFLADIKNRKRNLPPLLPDYSVIILDEAHKIEEVAREMYGDKIIKFEVENLTNKAIGILSNHYDIDKIESYVDFIQEANQKVFTNLKNNIIIPNDCKDENDIEKFQTKITPNLQNLLQNIRNKLERVNKYVEIQDTMGNTKNDNAQDLFYKIKELIEKMNSFVDDLDNVIYWLEEIETDNINLCCIPKDLDSKLYNDVFRKGIPVVLTSGTMSVDNDFSFLKNRLGLNKIKNIHEISVKSPFNYKDNCLIYLPEDIPYPNYDDENYIQIISNKINKLINITNGRTLVLFTSYKVLDLVYNSLDNIKHKFNFLKSVKSDTSIINRFKSGEKSVLFATGSCWEGIDIPGDSLLSLVIVKLPFPVPDPIIDYKKTLFKKPEDFVNQVLFPEMIIKLKQGFGRLIRTEQDIGVVSILDSRMNIGEKYREKVLKCLPECNVVDNTDDIDEFLKNNCDILTKSISV